MKFTVRLDIQEKRWLHVDYVIEADSFEDLADMDTDDIIEQGHETDENEIDREVLHISVKTIERS